MCRLSCTSRLSLVFLHGFFGGKKIPKSHTLPCWFKGEGEARCAQALGALRFAQQGEVALQVSPTWCYPFSPPKAEVYKSCAWHSWGSKRRFKVMARSLRFPPRAAEFGLQTDQVLQLPWAGDGLSGRSDILTVSHLQQCVLICGLKKHT